MESLYHVSIEKTLGIQTFFNEERDAQNNITHKNKEKEMDETDGI